MLCMDLFSVLELCAISRYAVQGYGKAGANGTAHNVSGRASRRAIAGNCDVQSRAARYTLCTLF